MADLEIIPRGSGFALGTIDAASPATAALADDLAAGDYVLVVASVDYLPASTNPGAPTCPVVSSWAQVAAQADPASGTTIMTIKAWLGRVTSTPTTAASRTVSVTQSPAESGLGVAARGYYGGSPDAVIALDGSAAGIADRSTPYTHTAATASGTKDLFVIAHSGIRFTGSPPYPNYAAVAGMEAWVTGSSNYKRMQVCTEKRTSSGSTGTRSQTVTGNTNALAGGAGFRFLLRSQGTEPPTVSTNQFLPFF